ncbi:MAG TPA: GNAT family N-acetyltransferase [Chloroflexia bacterium]|nr:GNAT family N-acetyltransferase [Chloroflexia bacterium]
MAHDTEAETAEGVMDLGDGLIMRAARTEDAEDLARFHATQQAYPPDTYDETIYHWMLELMSGRHPTFPPSDFLVVEDTVKGQIASSMSLISQVWSYGGVPFKVGQPELVSTHPDYRRKGLVRKQFDVVHRWSAERGELAQTITGIPWYYRQFGYELAIPSGGGRAGYTPHVPPLKEGAPEPYNVRPAAEADIPFLSQMLEQMSRRYLITVVKDEQQLRYEMYGRNEDTAVRKVLCVIETADAGPVGMLLHDHETQGTRIAAYAYEVKPGVSWAAVTPSVVRYLAATGREYAQKKEGDWNTYMFSLGTEHPAYAALPDRLPRVIKPYAWYVRVPDIAAFVRHVAPAIEQRIPGSAVEGHTGEVRLNFYRDGLLLGFEGGKIARAEAWRSARTEEGDAGFPNLTFLQLLFGFRSLEDLEYAFPDCWVRGDEVRALLNTIFPKRPSSVWANG